jgi:glycosyltransferase involved in cell wall biosynthesis
MKIAIDVSQIIYGTGVSMYTQNLVKGLLSYDKKNTYLIFGGSFRRFNELKSKIDLISESRTEKIIKKVFPYPPFLADLIWNRLRIYPPLESLIGEVDIFHSSDWVQPPSHAFNVTTVHDLVPIFYPKLSHPKLVAVHKRRLEIIKKEVDRIIVPSLVTKDDLLKLGFDGNKIRIIPEAPDISFRPQKKEEIIKLKRKYKISGKYLLAIGVTPRKNIERIIDAFEKIKAEYDLRLVVIGRHYTDIEDRRGVLYLGHVPKEDVPKLYAGSEALIYPSLYEGFGLPILEAFAAKTPVVTSNLGSMKEVAGSAAILVEPDEVNSVVQGIKEALSNKNLYIRLGRRRVKDYSWQSTVRETLKVYEEAR